MKDDGLDSLEQELRRLAPAEPPPALMQRLAREPGFSMVGQARPDRAPAMDAGPSAWRSWIWWLAPTAAAATVAAVLWLHRTGNGNTELESATAAVDWWMPEEIEVDRHLIATFEGVARMPDGMPFRFRCYNWDEELVARDASGSVEVRQREPRMEVIPVSLAVY